MRVWIALALILFIWVSKAYSSNHFFQLQPVASTGTTTNSVNKGGATSINFNFSFPLTTDCFLQENKFFHLQDVFEYL